jgi:ubiquinone/menaquinone biosynthesis C-methylase UbiE
VNDEREAANQHLDIATVSEAARVVGQHWRRSLYFDRAEPAMSRQWDQLIVPFLKESGAEIDFTATLDLAAGHGRNSVMLLPLAKQLYIADINVENIEFCKTRFRDHDHITYLVTDGFRLSSILSQSITFVYCFDSMVHFDSDVVRSYLGEFRRILKSGCFGFLHHSNYVENPGGSDYRKNPAGRNFMSRDLFKHYAVKEGLLVPYQKLIDWRRDGGLLDCFSLIQAA